MFRVVAGSGDDPYAEWTSSTALNEGQTEIRTTDENVAGTFKSPIVDHLWNKVKKVCCLFISKSLS